MAEQTVRKQLVEALEQLVLNINLTTTYGGNLLVLRPASPLAIGEALLANANLALDRARAEPEEEHCRDCGSPECPGYQAGANEGHSSGCNDDSCACWEAGHQEGLQVQREPAGRGTA